MTAISTLTTPSTGSVTPISDSIENLNVFAFLTPDPYDEEGDFEIEWVEGLPGFKKECKDHPLYDDHNMQLFENLAIVVEKEFKKGVEYLWPLLQHLEFSYLHINVDFLGIILNDRSVASYFYKRSNAKTGGYVFFAGYSLANKYMQNLQDPTPSSSKYEENIWRHELIHLLDHNNIINAERLRKSDSVDKLIKRYLLLYRTEGVADIIHLLLGQNEFESIEFAKVAFANELEMLPPSITNYQSKPSERMKDAFNTSSIIYDIGPWLIIDFLLQSGKEEVEALTKNCLSQLLVNEPIDYRDILKMVKYALEISNKDFLKYLKSQHITVESIINQALVNQN